MKFNLWILLPVICFSGCRDFLTESSQDEVQPSTVDDMEQLLIGEVYMTRGDRNFWNATQYFTDDVQCNGQVRENNPSDLATLEKYHWMFGWQKDMFDKNGGGNDVRFWEVPYQRIKGCNVVLDYLDRVTGNEEKRESLRGEALVMRAYYYLTLVNFFGIPYNSGDPEKNPGVPLKLHMDVTDKLLERNTVAEVYRRIEEDLLKGDSLLSCNHTSRNYARVDQLVAKAWLSRMYLYMEDWDKALDYADQVLSMRPELLDLAQADLGKWSEDGVYNPDMSPEIIWTRECGYSFNTQGYPAPFSLSNPGLAGLFDYDPDDSDHYGDLRGRLYLLWDTDYDTWTDYMLDVQKDNNGNGGLRTAELYLNRAEAYIHKYMKTQTDEFRVKALADLNDLRSHRYDTRNTVYVPVEYTRAEDLYGFYKEERRRELCGEDNHRWFDLRRYGMPELKHTFFIRSGEGQEYVLDASRYVLPIPEAARKANANLEQNP